MEKIKQLYVTPKMEAVFVNLEHCIAASSAKVSPGNNTNDYHPIITDEEEELKQSEWNL